MPFLFFLLLFFIAEVCVLSAVVDSIGFLGTLGLLFLGLMIGGSLINRQGKTGRGIFSASPQSSDPQNAFGVLFNLLSGLLFIFPGFISDALALLLLLPPVRLLALAWLGNWLMARVGPRMQRMQGFTFGPRNWTGGAASGRFRTGASDADAFRTGSSGINGNGRSGTGTDGFGSGAGSGFDHSGFAGNSSGSTRPHDSDEVVIEGEFRDVTEELKRRPEELCSEKDQS